MKSFYVIFAVLVLNNFQLYQVPVLAKQAAPAPPVEGNQTDPSLPYASQVAPMAGQQPLGAYGQPFQPGPTPGYPSYGQLFGMADMAAPFGQPPLAAPYGQPYAPVISHGQAFSAFTPQQGRQQSPYGYPEEAYSLNTLSGQLASGMGYGSPMMPLGYPGQPGAGMPQFQAFGGQPFGMPGGQPFMGQPFGMPGGQPFMGQPFGMPGGQPFMGQPFGMPGGQPFMGQPFGMPGGQPFMSQPFGMTDGQPFGMPGGQPFGMPGGQPFMGQPFGMPGGQPFMVQPFGMPSGQPLAGEANTSNKARDTLKVKD